MRILLIVPLMLLVGCSKESEKDSKTTIDTKKGKVTIERKDGGRTTVVQTEDGQKLTKSDKEGVTRIETKDGTMTFNENKLPQGFPLAILPNSKVEAGHHMKPANQAEVFHAVTKSAEAPEKVAEFYEKALKDKQIKVEKSQMANDTMTQVMLIGKSEKPDGPKIEASVIVIREANKKETSAAITWSIKK